MPYATKRKKTSPPPVKQGEKREKRYKTRKAEPVSVAADNDQIKIEGFRDQSEQQWIAVTRRSATAYISLNLLMFDPQAAYKNLADQGVYVLLPGMKGDLQRQVDANRAWRRGLYVAKKPGYHRGAYVQLDRSVIGKPQSKRFHVAFDSDPVPLSRKGSLEEWQQLVRIHVRGQSVFILALGMAFVGLILRLVSGMPNVGVELTGATSTGKSTALDVGASVYGAPLGQRGSIAFSLRGTVNGVEKQMLARDGTVFFGDEANLFGAQVGDRQRGQMLSELVFMVGEGVEKARYNDPKVRRASYGWFITSNRSLLELLRGENRETVNAVLVRLITVPADVGNGWGVYDTLPKPFTSSGDAIQALKAGLEAHHGRAATAFIKRLAKVRSTGDEAFKAKVIGLRDAFVTRTHVDPNVGAELRRAQAFGMIYAALQLAVEWDVLPFKKVLRPLLACHERATAMRTEDAAEPSATERVRDYVDSYRTRMISHGNAKRTIMDDTALEELAGIKARRKGCNVLLIHKARWDAEFGNDGHTMLAELKRQGRLQTTTGNQLQIKVRANADKNRMYAVIVG